MIASTKTNSSPYEAVARRAYEIWQTQGSPAGRDMDFWLEAERELSNPQGHGNGHTQASAPAADPKAADLKPEHASGHPASSPSPGEAAARALQQKKEARAPHLPDGRNAHPSVPPQSGKPLWDKPHSK